MKTCSECEKQIEKRDIFYLNYNELINPFTGFIEYSKNGFCLSCYRKKANQLRLIQAQIKN